MIFILELHHPAAPRVWFAHDEEDLLRKLAAQDALRDWRAHGSATLRELLETALRARGDSRIYWDESEATAAFERTQDPAWQGPGWRARWALREQLIATEVLADDL